uniref:Uncharacterized protein MANES_05G106000 n=1 Tax=Rhizophora mucronata TaxID=61149 RepID=A0A2P2K222_RHIMU
MLGIYVVLFIVFSLLVQLHGIDDAIDKSKKVLSSMSRMITRNKWIVGLLVAALVVAIIIIILYKLYH